MRPWALAASGFDGTRKPHLAAPVAPSVSIGANQSSGLIDQVQRRAFWMRTYTKANPPASSCAGRCVEVSADVLVDVCMQSIDAWAPCLEAQISHVP